jgi:hypothetical protein
MEVVSTEDDRGKSNIYERRFGRGRVYTYDTQRCGSYWILRGPYEPTQTRSSFSEDDPAPSPEPVSLHPDRPCVLTTWRLWRGCVRKQKRTTKNIGINNFYIKRTNLRLGG